MVASPETLLCRPLRGLDFLFANKPSDKSPGYFRPSAARTTSESLSESDLKTVVVVARTQIPRRPLLVLRDEGQTVRHAILNRQNLIRIRSDVRRIGHRQVFGDLLLPRQTRRWCRSVWGNYGIDCQAEPEQFVRGARNRRVDQRVSQQARRRA